MNDLNELQFFVQVSRTQSFTQAARKLGVPKSSVSRAIRRLEDRLGVRLIDRTTRSVALTEAGELYRSHCQRIMDQAEEAEQAVGALLATPRGRLSIGAPVAFARSVIGPMLGEFLAAHPDLQVDLHLLHGAENPDQEDLDMLVKAGPLEDSGMLVKPLMRIRLGAYASPDYLERCSMPQTPGDLAQHSCVTTSCSQFGLPAGYTILRLRRSGELCEVRVSAKVSVPDPTVNHLLAEAGVGIALLSQSMAARETEEGRLVRVLPEWEPDPVELYALYPPRLSASPKVQAFLQFFRETYGQKAWLGETGSSPILAKRHPVQNRRAVKLT
ncbi:LysR family transcriptional regulator [Acidicapsa dinghuensis]|uniref:LysR family transcriptional regulator n=1 Tax=Acidicapsa dinghuensis TaxID=2218256 RepID=A0ABW1EJW8_9BACT|nr:LysR family transcriptional regulator [Acidicapsa dinghuensis]